MLRSTVRRLLGAPRPELDRARGVRQDVPLPLDMFDSPMAPDLGRKLAGIYHKGQAKVWDGRAVLDELVTRHGRPTLDPTQTTGLQGLFAVILWGELAAWRVSAALALRLEPLEAKLAATSQAHDEARHFYVMRDYLALLGDVPTQLGPATRRVLEGTLRASSLTRQLMGMQLMIEPMALTLFQLVRERSLEPVLAELLAYYERDEARHVALGVLHLPRLLAGMTLPEAARLWRWEFAEYWAQIDMLRELEPHFLALGIDPREVVAVGRTKQVRANQLLMEELGYDLEVSQLLLRFFEAKAEWDFPSVPRSNLPIRARNAVEKLAATSFRDPGDTAAADALAVQGGLERFMTTAPAAG
jgi:hypothetical protein